MTTNPYAFDIALDSTPEAATKNEQSNIYPWLKFISISQLLGRDYVFIDMRTKPELFNTSEKMVQIFTTALRKLELASSQTLFIGVSGSLADEAPTFSRQEILWQRQQVSQHENILITSQEQQDFMNMIWECSSRVEQLTANKE